MAYHSYASHYIGPSSMQYNQTVQSYIQGPLSSSQTPGQLEYHSYGTLTGIHPNPPHFSPMNSDGMFSNSRLQFKQTDASLENKQQMLAREKIIATHPSSQYFSSPLGRTFATQGYTNYISPTDSSLYIQKRRAMAIGKQSYKIGLPFYAPLSNKSYNNNDVKSTVGRLRRAGCVAPKKKGALENRTFSIL